MYLLFIFKKAVGTIGNCVFKDKATGPFGKVATSLKNSVAIPLLFNDLSDNKHTCFPLFNLLTNINQF